MSRQILRLFRHATRNCCDLTTNPSSAPQPHILHSRHLQQLTFNNVLNKSAPLVLSRHKSNQAGKKKGGNKTKSNLNTIIDRLGDDEDDDDIDDAMKGHRGSGEALDNPDTPLAAFMTGGSKPKSKGKSKGKGKQDSVGG